MAYTLIISFIYYLFFRWIKPFVNLMEKRYKTSLSLSMQEHTKKLLSIGPSALSKFLFILKNFVVNVRMTFLFPTKFCQSLPIFKSAVDLPCKNTIEMSINKFERGRFSLVRGRQRISAKIERFFDDYGTQITWK